MERQVSTLLDILGVLQDAGVKISDQELKTKVQNAHDDLGFLLGLWALEGRPFKARDMMIEAAYKLANNVNKTLSAKPERVLSQLDELEYRAMTLGVDTAGKSLSQVLKEIDTKVTQISKG